MQRYIFFLRKTNYWGIIFKKKRGITLAKLLSLGVTTHVLRLTEWLLCCNTLKYDFVVASRQYILFINWFSFEYIIYFEYIQMLDQLLNIIFNILYLVLEVRFPHINNCIADTVFPYSTTSNHSFDYSDLNLKV